jgi:hypothetical protein
MHVSYASDSPSLLSRRDHSVDTDDVKRTSEEETDTSTNRRNSLARPMKYDIVAAVFRQMFPNTFFCTIPVHNDKEVRIFSSLCLSRYPAMDECRGEEVLIA